MPGTVAAIVLAAGAGRRFGGPKALLRFRGDLLVERAAALARAAGCSPVIVVLGAGASEVSQRADLSGHRVVVAEEWSKGMGHSLRAGLDAAAATCTAGAALILLVDQPLIGVDAVRHVIAAWDSGATAAIATYAGVPGHPVLFDRAVWPEVAAAAEGDVGARGWLRANNPLVATVPCDGTGSPRDIDSPQDLLDLESLPHNPP